MRISVRWWLTAGCDWPSSLHSAETCICPSCARASTIFSRDLSASSLKTSVRFWMSRSGTFSGEAGGASLAPWPVVWDLRFMGSDTLLKVGVPQPEACHVGSPPVRQRDEHGRTKAAQNSPGDDR